MIHPAYDRDPLEALVDDFVSRLREGETPSVAEYTSRYPELAEEIEALFPTVAVMEQYRTHEEHHRRSELHAGRVSSVPEHLDDFRIIREIGRGGMGVVYEAEQRSLARRVALKVLPKHALLLEKDRHRFQREAQTAAKLHHTNIVPVFGMGEHDGHQYYVMPLVRGVGLDRVIRDLRNGPEDERSGPRHWMQVARAGVQAAGALAYAHGHGTLHRDVKPGNLLVDENGDVLVADFGLARAVDHGEIGQGGEVVGTPRYVAPEQLQGNAEPRSDLYSLGLTLYEFLTLQPAFDGRSDRTHPEKAEPTRPREVDPRIPRDLEAVILKCLALKPEHRYPDADTLAGDLQRYLEGRPVRARRIMWPERSWRWCRRNPALAGLMTLASMLLIAVGLTALAGHLRTRTAYAQTMAALDRAEATSLVALETLDDIYLQLSPDRFWIQSGVDARGEACVCLGLRSGSGSLASRQRTAMQLHATEETAALLEGLLVCYDRLAEQASDNTEVQLQSATACRRLGDIRQLLGQLAEAKCEYERATERLLTVQSSEPDDVAIALELARTYNGLGNLQSAGMESALAYASHRRAFETLQAAGPVRELPPEGQYEMARTLYLLANKPTFELGNRRGEGKLSKAARPYSSRQCRASATQILENLVAGNPSLPDYRFLLALCLRPAGTNVLSREDRANRQRAITILEELKTLYPDVLDYRYELATTYAWVHVGLFPWQEPSAEPYARSNLGMALVESRWLMEHCPSIPHYSCSSALILAKLGELAAQAGHHAKAASHFREAVDTQASAIERFPELPLHYRVLCEFMRFKTAQSMLNDGRASGRLKTSDAPLKLAEETAANLASLLQRPEVADDRLALAAMPLVRGLLNSLQDGE